MSASEGAPALLDTARQQAGLSEADLWLRYLALGGRATLPTLRQYLLGVMAPGATEHDVLAQALNERFRELDLDSPVTYSDGT
jgi:hypothetical protein